MHNSHSGVVHFAPPRRTHHRRTLLAPMPERAGSLVQRELAREARLRDCMLPVTVSSDPLRRFAPGRVAKCNTPCQNDELRNTIRHFDSPAGGLLNAKGAQGRPFHTFPAKFLCIFLGCCYFATVPFGRMRSADCLAHRSWRADVGIGPYEKTGSGSVGADCISARAPPRRMHRRRTHPYGEGNHRTPVRIIARFRAAIQAAPACRKSLFATLCVFLNFLKSLKIRVD